MRSRGFNSRIAIKGRIPTHVVNSGCHIECTTIFVDYVGNDCSIIYNLVFFNKYSLKFVSGTLRHNYFGNSPPC